MKIPEGSCLFHLEEKGRINKEIYIYIASKKEWDKKEDFPTDYPGLEIEELEDFFEDIGLIREDYGIYRLETPIFKQDLIGQLTDSGFEEQDDFSAYINKMLKEKDSESDDDSIDDDDEEDGFEVTDYLDIIPDEDSYKNDD